jgi:hypothetical protein
MLLRADETRAGVLLDEARQDVAARWAIYQQLATAAPQDGASQPGAPAE